MLIETYDLYFVVMDVLRKLEGTCVGIDNTHLDTARLDTLEQLLRRQFGPDFKVKFIQRFRSKKNIVMHLEVQSDNHESSVNIVAKLFVTGYFKNERNILFKCREEGLTVPRVLAAENGVILMDFIPGKTLTEWVNKTFDSEIVDKLAHWYYRFHELTGLVKEDPRLRNFICNGDAIVGVDFEEAHPGSWIIDIAGVSASLLDTDPIYDKRKRVLAWRLLETYLSLHNLKRNIDFDGQFIDKIVDSLEKTAHWRQDTRIEKLAELIKRDGIQIE